MKDGMFNGTAKFLNDPIRFDKIENALQRIVIALLLVVIALITFIAFSGYYIVRNRRDWAARPPYVEGLIRTYERAVTTTGTAIWVAAAIGLAILVPYMIFSIATSH